MTRPTYPPAAGLPERVTVYEVGPRDGLQAESQIVPTDIKAEFCRRLLDTGLSALELTSFVSPRWVPQLADAEELLSGVDMPADVRGIVLVPNTRGLDRALAAGATEIAVFVSATETFARKNLNRGLDEAVADAAAVTHRAKAAGLRVRGYVSMCFGDPWEGAVSEQQVADVTTTLLEAGVDTISLGDTIGVATAGQVQQLLGTLITAGIGAETLAMHFHDTYGQAVTNVYAALEFGITEFDSSAGGLGRCPYAKGATGNLATEDLLWLLHGLGIDTGVDLDAVVDTTQWLADVTGITPNSRVATALQAARPSLGEHTTVRSG